LRNRPMPGPGCLAVVAICRPRRAWLIRDYVKTA